MKNVLVTKPIRDAGMDILRKNVNLIVSPDPDPSEVIKHLCGINALLTRTTPIDAEMMRQGKDLEVIACHGAGTDKIDLVAAAERGIAVLNAPGVNARSVAEYTVCMMLTLSRRLVNAEQPSQLTRNFAQRDIFIGSDLHQKTVGIIGLGHIGTMVADICTKGFGMRAIGYNPSRPADYFKEKGIEQVLTLNDLLPESDFVTLHCPLTKPNVGMIGQEHFSIMKPSAYLINAARARLVREPDLIQALETGMIAGAAVDVFSPEPPDGESPLLRAPGLIATPHIAAFSADSMDRASVTVAQDILRVLNGQTPVNRVV